MNHRTDDAQRYSPLDTNKDNVKSLKLAYGARDRGNGSQRKSAIDTAG